MSKLEYFLISEGVSVDQRTNRLSIFNIFENVSADKFPASVPFVTAVVSLIKEDEDHGKDLQLLLKIHSPGVEKTFELTLNFVMESERHRLLMSIDNIKVGKSGDMTFELYLNESLIATRMVKVILIHPKAEQS
ncbi:MAG: hypothetical protein IH950_03220 [Bacteroidetes bacterium]|nr:hypothetical protein [Bacteroidota bacterium]